MPVLLSFFLPAGGKILNYQPHFFLHHLLDHTQENILKVLVFLLAGMFHLHQSLQLFHPLLP